MGVEVRDEGCQAKDTGKRDATLEKCVPNVGRGGGVHEWQSSNGPPKQHFFRPRSQRTPQPISKWQTKPHFGFMQNFFGQIPDRFREQRFVDLRIQFYMCGQTHDVIDEYVIDERNSDFQCVAHAHDVGVAQERIA